MAYTTINKSTDYFSSDLWSGNSSTQSINVGKNFSSNGSLIWIKGRNGSGKSHRLLDSVRGKENLLASNSTDAQFTESGDGVASYSSTGFNLQFSSQNDYNESGGNYVGSNWLAGSSPTGSANTDGSISSTVSANTTAGFSIVKYQGTGANATVGHGLGAVPKMIFFKSLTNGISWIVYSSELNISSSNCLRLNGTNAAFTESAWNGTRPTTSVFSLGTHNEANNNSGETIAYCFAEKTGYSKFGSYVGNGNADGTFIYTGFKPAWVMCKISNTTDDWYMFNNKMPGYNLINESLRANTSDAQNSTGQIDFTSNGFKTRTSNAAVNGGSQSYIYMAFGQSLVGSNNVPCTAR